MINSATSNVFAHPENASDAAAPANEVVMASQRAEPGMLRQVMLVARKEFGDRFRSGWVLACILVWLGAVGLTSFFGLVQIGRMGLQGFDRTVLSLLNLVQYLVPLLGLLLGHDLIVSEVEERTLRLVLASGLSRTRLFLGKFVGGVLALGVPLLLGFVVAGTVIALSTRDNNLASFIRLATSGLVLGILFLALGLSISAFCRTRVQALVTILLAWCVAVFVFDLVALGVLVSTRVPAAAHEIELVCDAAHVNGAVDIHSAFDSTTTQPEPKRREDGSSLGWLAANPVDLFRAVNLQGETDVTVPSATILASAVGWLLLTLGAGLWRLRRADL